MRKVGAYLIAMSVTAALGMMPPTYAQSQWRMAAPLPAPVGEITGAVIGDQWYVLAGLDPATHRPLGVIYVFNAKTGNWAQKKSMAQPAHHVMTTVLNDKLYVFGGFRNPANEHEETNEAGWQPINSSWAYDPTTETWTPLAPMPTPRGAGGAVALNGKIYVIGGVQADVRDNPTAPLSPGSPQRVLGTVEEYDPATNQWSTRASMPTPRNHLFAEAVGGKVYAIGGRIGSAQITVAEDTNIVEEYDPLRDQWIGKGRAPIRRSGMAGAVANGRIYLAGGEYQDWEGAKAFWAVQSYDPATDHWDTLPRMQLAHHGFAAGIIGGTLHVAGGGFQSDGMPNVNTKTAVHEMLQIEP
jgi:N-acetylneuraminic acid mutarotase